MLSVVDELAQVVGCLWIMRDSGGSLAQNCWQGDLGLTAVGQDDTGGGRHVDFWLIIYFCYSDVSNIIKYVKWPILSHEALCCQVHFELESIPLNKHERQ